MAFTMLKILVASTFVLFVFGVLAYLADYITQRKD